MAAKTAWRAAAAAAVYAAAYSNVWIEKCRATGADGIKYQAAKSSGLARLSGRRESRKKKKKITLCTRLTHSAAVAKYYHPLMKRKGA